MDKVVSEDGAPRSLEEEKEAGRRRERRTKSEREPERERIGAAKGVGEIPQTPAIPSLPPLAARVSRPACERRLRAAAAAARGLRAHPARAPLHRPRPTPAPSKFYPALDRSLAAHTASRTRIRHPGAI